jgi:hypothetical protein
MDECICKSDCMFSNNAAGVCKLPRIEMVQSSPNSSQFTCAQYLKENNEDKHLKTKMDRSRAAGMYDILSKKIKNK